MIKKLVLLFLLASSVALAEGTVYPLHPTIFPSVGNSTTTPLDADATFTGEWENVIGFEELTINGGGVGSSGTLVFEFSPDGTNADVSILVPVTSPNFVPLPLRVILPYFRVKFINGPLAQDEFRLMTVNHKSASKHLTRFSTQTPGKDEPFEMVQTVPASSSTAEDDGSCTSGAANFTVIGAQTGRKVLFIYADPRNTDYVFVKLGTTATIADAPLAPGQGMSFDTGKVYEGPVDAFPLSGTQGVCKVAL